MSIFVVTPERSERESSIRKVAGCPKAVEDIRFPNVIEREVRDWREDADMNDALAGRICVSHFGLHRRRGGHVCMRLSEKDNVI